MDLGKGKTRDERAGYRRRDPDPDPQLSRHLA
jgi:hypothetical protein